MATAAHALTDANNNNNNQGRSSPAPSIKPKTLAPLNDERDADLSALGKAKAA
jgi:hypothetical protein